MITNKIGIYAIRDGNIKCYCPPFFAASDDDAKRMLADAAEVGSILARFPEDYSLFFFGEFDSRDGLVNPVESFVAAMSDILRDDVVKASKAILEPPTAIAEEVTE